MGAGLLSLASVGLFLWLIWDGLDEMGKEEKKKGIRKIVLKSKINYQLSMYAIDIQNK